MRRSLFAFAAAVTAVVARLLADHYLQSAMLASLCTLASVAFILLGALSLVFDTNR